MGREIGHSTKLYPVKLMLPFLGPHFEHVRSRIQEAQSLFLALPSRVWKAAREVSENHSPTHTEMVTAKWPGSGLGGIRNRFHYPLSLVVHPAICRTKLHFHDVHTCWCRRWEWAPRSKTADQTPVPFCPFLQQTQTGFPLRARLYPTQG